MFPWRQATAWMVLLLSVACGGASAPAMAAERTGEPPAVRVVLDWRTGLALYGMDPVTYFSEGEALAGLPEFELGFGGAIWRFRNEGNRAAFLADPEVYTPRFAGRDPMAIARGVATAGSPLVWFLYEQRLYLFHAEASRSAFRADPRSALTAAETRWPAVVQTIDPGSLVPALRVGEEASPRQSDHRPQ